LGVTKWNPTIILDNANNSLTGHNMMHIYKSVLDTFSALLILFIAACNSSSNQTKRTEVPEILDAAFKEKYSDIPRVWQKHHYGYEAIFVQNKIKHEAEFSDKGEWLETELYVTAKEFPDAVLKRIRQAYPNFKITKYEIEITPQGKFYEVDITDGEIEDELYFNANGNNKIDFYED
jgi:disulfide oxidoreductase YuzD